MAKNNLKLIALAILFAPASAFSQVYFNELMYDPKSADESREWVEICNTSGSEIDMSGWRFYEAKVNHKLISLNGESAIIPSGACAVIVQNASVFMSEYPEYRGKIFDSSYSLSNTGEALGLRNSIGELVSEISYSSSVGGNGDGNTLGLIGKEWVSTSPTPGNYNVRALSQEIKKDVARANEVTVVSIESAEQAEAYNYATATIAIASGTSASLGISREDSMLKWYGLLAAVIILGIAGIWFNRDRKTDKEEREFTIIEEKD